MDQAERGTDFDPADMEAARAAGYRAVDLAIARLEGVRGRAVWTPMSGAQRESFARSLPEGPEDLGALVERFAEEVLPTSMGADHPRFWGWYMGGGNFAGALGEFLATVDGSNLGGGDTGAAAMERQVLGWLADAAGFPEDCGGVLASSGSMANFLGLAVARQSVGGAELRRKGLAALDRPLRFYGSVEAHSCGAKALEAMGHGTEALRLIGTGAGLRMDVAALRAAIAEDRAAGWRPACVIATAGATNTGAIDPLDEIADLCAEQGLWMHVDACVGGALIFSDRHRGLLSGLERAQSVALDLHKWLQVPFCAGAVLVRDRAAHRATFAAHPDYLVGKARGPVATEFFGDYGMDLSRPFAALKVWMTFLSQGRRRLGAMLEHGAALARDFAAMVEEAPELELCAPVPINVVCFRYRPDGERDESRLAALNSEILLRLQERGEAVLSDTLIGGRSCLRLCIGNHRTGPEDIAFARDAVLRTGREILAEG